jgi:hypothetical protein
MVDKVMPLPHNQCPDLHPAQVRSPLEALAGQRAGRGGGGQG